MESKVNKIYEIREGFHIDLSRIIAIRQFVDIEGQGKDRRQRCWIEVYMDCDQIVVIDYVTIEDLQDSYNLILTAWQSYANQEEPILI